MLFGIGFSHRGTDEKLSQKNSGIISREGDAVGRSWVIKKAGVELADGLFGDEVDGDFFSGYFVKIE
jgi:hypothetical protein